MSYKSLKKEIRDLLQKNSVENTFSALEKYKPEKIISPLRGLLYDPDELIKFKAVSLFGIIASEISSSDLEILKDLMRKFMWNLNEESGGLGWGTPEAMGEIATSVDEIFRSFHKIIISYIDENSSSYLDHRELHPGVIWGIGRMAKTHPHETALFSKDILKNIIDDDDPRIRGLAIIAAGRCRLKDLENIVSGHLEDEALIDIYEDEEIKRVTIKKTAENAITLMNK